MTALRSMSDWLSTAGVCFLPFVLLPGSQWNIVPNSILAQRRLVINSNDDVLHLEDCVGDLGAVGRVEIIRHAF